MAASREQTLQEKKDECITLLRNLIRQHYPKISQDDVDYCVSNGLASKFGVTKPRNEASWWPVVFLPDLNLDEELDKKLKGLFQNNNVEGLVVTQLSQPRQGSYKHLFAVKSEAGLTALISLLKAGINAENKEENKAAINPVAAAGVGVSEFYENPPPPYDPSRESTPPPTYIASRGHRTVVTPGLFGGGGASGPGVGAGAAPGAGAAAAHGPAPAAIIQLDEKKRQELNQMVITFETLLRNTTPTGGYPALNFDQLIKIYQQKKYNPLTMEGDVYKHLKQMSQDGEKCIKALESLKKILQLNSISIGDSDKTALKEMKLLLVEKGDKEGKLLRLFDNLLNDLKINVEHGYVPGGPNL